MSHIVYIERHIVSMTLQPSQPLPGIFYLSNTRVDVFPIASHPLEGSSCAAVLYNEVRRGACCHNRPRYIREIQIFRFIVLFQPIEAFLSIPGKGV